MTLTNKQRPGVKEVHKYIPWIRTNRTIQMYFTLQKAKNKSEEMCTKL